jgi:hypothetical protein
MGRFLRDKDYQRALSDDDHLLELILENKTIRQDIELASQGTMRSYLLQRYDVDRVFAHTKIYNCSETYKAGNLVEYSEPEFLNTKSYLQGDRISRNNQILEAKTNLAPSVFNAANWSFVCDDKELFSVKYPHQEFDYKDQYEQGSKVWYRDRVYTSTRRVSGVFPTDTEIWGAGVPFSVTAKLPTDTTVFEQGDNRYQLLVTYLLDIIIYHFGSKILYRNFPVFRQDRFNMATDWLKAVSGGIVNAEMIKKQPEQGLPMRSGSVSSINSPNMLW